MTDQTTFLAHVVAEMIRSRPAHRLLFAYDELMEESVIRECCPDPGLHLHGPSHGQALHREP
jgi:hypothetical protein